VNRQSYSCNSKTSGRTSAIPNDSQNKSSHSRSWDVFSSSQAPSHQCHESLLHTHHAPSLLVELVSILQGSKFGGLSNPQFCCYRPRLSVRVMRGLPVKVPRASGRDLASEIQSSACHRLGFSLWKSRRGDRLSEPQGGRNLSAIHGALL
jgi:hypothetical protein